MNLQLTPEQQRINAAMLLTLWAQCAERPRVEAGDKTRQMKLAFLAALCASKEKVSAYNLSFYGWTWGPMSNEVYASWGMLEASGLVESEEEFVFTRAGLRLASEFYADVLGEEPNALVREIVDGVANEWRPRPGARAILDHVYAVELPLADNRTPIALRDVRKGIAVLDPVDHRTARATLHVSGGWRETLALAMVPAATRDIELAIADYAAGRVHVA